MEIREIHHQDYSKIHSLIINEMGHDEVTFDELSERLNLIRSDKSYFLNVAINEKEIIGFISAIKSIGCIDGTSIEVCCLVVSQSYQKQGVGGALLGCIENIGLSEGITQFSLASGLHRKGAHAFFENRNYEKGGYAFYKGLTILKDT